MGAVEAGAGVEMRCGASVGFAGDGFAAARRDALRWLSEHLKDTAGEAAGQEAEGAAVGEVMDVCEGAEAGGKIGGGTENKVAVTAAGDGHHSLPLFPTLSPLVLLPQHMPKGEQSKEQPEPGQPKTCQPKTGKPPKVGPGGTLTLEEARAVGSVATRLYGSYLVSAGGRAFAAVWLLLGLSVQVAYYAQTLVFSAWVRGRRWMGVVTTYRHIVFESE